MPYMMIYKGTDNLWHLWNECNIGEKNLGERKRVGGPQNEKQPPIKTLCPVCFAFLPEFKNAIPKCIRTNEQIKNKISELSNDEGAFTDMDWVFNGEDEVPVTNFSEHDTLQTLKRFVHWLQSDEEYKGK